MRKAGDASAPLGYTGAMTLRLALDHITAVDADPVQLVELAAATGCVGIGLFMPFVVAAALKSAQGSTTVALVTTSALVAPMLGQLGLDSEMGRVLTVMAIGAGAMTVSHANDSFFWVVTQFSRMPVAVAYRAQTVATLIQGLAGIITVWLLSLVLL